MKAETRAGWLAAGRTALAAQGIATAALDARLLFLAATGLAHQELIANPEVAVPPYEAEIFAEFIARRMQHEPVARILGTREFFGRSFTISPAVLDPRADTETLVNLALKHAGPQARFVDLGTGSGAIAITLCAERPDLAGLASDVSPAALALALENAQRLGVAERLNFVESRWFDALTGAFDLIVSNPPYIRLDADLMEDVRHYDPPLALFGGTDGLAAYRAIAAGAGAHLTPNGAIALEIGQGQAADVEQIFESHGFALAETCDDLGGIARALAFRRN